MGIKEAKEKNKARLFSCRGVVAVGVGTREVGGNDTAEPCIVVGVKRKLPQGQLQARDIIPRQVSHWFTKYQTDVIEMGEIVALERIGRVRPIPGGVSFGHFGISAGTLGARVQIKEGVPVLLSNNHVLAKSNDGKIGDAILQPGAADGGGPADEVATLIDFVPIRFEGFNLPDDCQFAQVLVRLLNGACKLIGSETRYSAQEEGESNLVDAAIASPSDAAVFLNMILDANDQPTIQIKGPASLQIGDPVVKSGRTTGFTHGQVTVIDATVQISYGGLKIGVFEDQVIIGTPGFSAGGDSGSVILLDTDLLGQYKIGGLLFAGSDSQTIANRIENVIQLLGLDIRSW